jgi:hypothetical protein
MVTWVIEHGIFDNEVQLIEEVRKQGHNVIEIDYKHDYYVDDIARNQRYTKLLSQPVIFRGSLNVSSEVEYTLWIPGTYCNRDNFNCSTYYTYWGEWMLNKNYWMMPLSNLERMTPFIQAYLATNSDYIDKVFIRPASDMKQFAGEVFNLSNLSSLKDIPPETLVLVAPVKQVDREYRFVVTGNTIVAGSQYLPIETNVTSNAAIEYLQSILNELTWCPDDIYTVDVCFANGSYHVLELNSLSCSNLYQCDLAAVVETVSKLAINEYDYWNE